MVPTEFMPGAVAMLADSGAQLFYFGDELVPGELFKVVAHSSAASYKYLTTAQLGGAGAVMASLFSVVCLLQGFDIEFLHLEHGMHDACRFFRIFVLQHLD